MEKESIFIMMELYMMENGKMESNKVMEWKLMLMGHNMLGSGRQIINKAMEN